MVSAKKHPPERAIETGPETDEAPDRPARISADLSGAQSAPSRPHQLLAQLSEAFDPENERDDRRRWAPRRTLAFVLLTCGTFWLIAFAAGLSLIF